MSEHDDERDDETEAADDEAGDETAGDDEQPDETPADEPVNEPDSLAQMEEIGKKLDGVQKYVARKMGEILGEHAADFEVCDLCSYWNTPGWRHTGQLPAELIDQLLHVLNQRAPADLLTDEYSRACTKCNGEGIVLTGSKVPGQDRLPCVDCKGLGWQPVGPERGGALLARANGPATPYGTLSTDDVGMRPAIPEEAPEVQALRAQGYLVVPPAPVA